MFVAWLASRCWALPLWVAPEAVSEAEATLRELWPEAELEVRATPMGTGEKGLLWDGSQLVWSSEEGTYVESASDLATAVLIARTWLREHPELQLGWIPAVEIEMPEERPNIAPPPVDLARWAWTVAGGAQISPSREWRTDGPRFSFSLLYPHTELGFTTFLAIERDVRLSLAERVLDNPQDYPGVILYTPLETVLLTVHASWDFGAGSPPGSSLRPGKVLGALCAKPRVLGGLEIRDGYVRSLEVEPTEAVYSNSDSYFDFGPVFGVGADLWLGAVGVRALAGERFGLFTPDGPALTRRSFVAVELVARISQKASPR